MFGGDRISPVLTPEKKNLDRVNVHLQVSPNSFDSQEPVPEARDLVVSLEKPTIEYLSVRVMDPFSQMKQNVIRYWTMQTSVNCNNFVPSQSFT